jgi:hypothetical protein
MSEGTSANPALRLSFSVGQNGTPRTRQAGEANRYTTVTIVLRCSIFT